MGLGWVDFDAAFEVGAVFDADAGGGNVADDRAIRLDVNAVPRMDVADYLAIDDYFAGVNFGIELGCRTYRELVAAQGNRAVDLSINLQVFGAGDMTFDL